MSNKIQPGEYGGTSQNGGHPQPTPAVYYGDIYPPSPPYQPEAGYPHPEGTHTDTIIIYPKGVHTIEFPRGHQAFYEAVPRNIECQYCVARGTTETERRIGRNGWLLCVIAALFGCWCGCCLYPLCVFKDTVHRCSNCKRIVGFQRDDF